MAFRCDSSRLSKGERTPQGFYRFDARLTRTGILEYVLPSGKISRELRRPEEVFKADSLASLDGVPLTVWHVVRKATPENVKGVRVGGVRSVRADGNFVAGSVQIDDAKTIAAIENGELEEISSGYECVEDHTPGIYQGKPYDLEQKQITYNHAALLPKGSGRAGSAVALRLDAADAGDPVLVSHFDAVDSAGNNPLDQSNSASEKITMLIGKIELKLDAKDEAVIAAHLAELEAKSAKAEATAAAGAQNVTALQAKLDAATSPAAVQAAVSARVALETVARRVLGEDDVSAKTDGELRSAVVAKALPALKLDGKTDAEVRCFFEVAAALPSDESGGAEKTDAKEVAKDKLRAASRNDSGAGTKETPEQARAAMIEKRRCAGSAPLATSK